MNTTPVRSRKSRTRECNRRTQSEKKEVCGKPAAEIRERVRNGGWNRLGGLAEQSEAGSGFGRRPLPCQCGSGAIASSEGTALPAAEYPATRDLQAAIRFVRANSEKYGVDPSIEMASRIAIAGGSAGVISSIAAGVVDEDDYKTELLADDPTLASTSISIQAARYSAL
jgi:hypothetical protein